MPIISNDRNMLRQGTNNKSICTRLSLLGDKSLIHYSIFIIMSLDFLVGRCELQGNLSIFKHLIIDVKSMWPVIVNNGLINLKGMGGLHQQCEDYLGSGYNVC